MDDDDMRRAEAKAREILRQKRAEEREQEQREAAQRDTPPANPAKDS